MYELNLWLLKTPPPLIFTITTELDFARVNPYNNCCSQFCRGMVLCPGAMHMTLMPQASSPDVASSEQGQPELTGSTHPVNQLCSQQPANEDQEISRAGRSWGAPACPS